jgi:putative tributyrin esterase
MIQKTTFFFLFLCQMATARVDTVAVFSKANQKTLKNAVVLPQNYADKPLPVLYLLHGFSDNFDGWLRFPPDKQTVQKMADKYQLIIVCPDGGYGSWYLDSPLKKDSQYETFLTAELIPFVDKNYKTLSNRESRLISGLSMGGHGALYLAARHPDLFVAAGSIAGAVDIEGRMKMLNAEKDNIYVWFIKILGSYQQFPDRYRQNSVVNMVDKLKAANLKLIIDCGTGDWLFNANKILHQKLLTAGVEHDYTERPGVHNWQYFAGSLEYHLIFFDRIVKR